MYVVDDTRDTSQRPKAVAKPVPAGRGGGVVGGASGQWVHLPSGRRYKAASAEQVQARARSIPPASASRGHPRRTRDKERSICSSNHSFGVLEAGREEGLARRQEPVGGDGRARRQPGEVWCVLDPVLTADWLLQH